MLQFLFFKEFCRLEQDLAIGNRPVAIVGDDPASTTSRVLLRRLDPDIVRLAGKTLQYLGVALGAKQAAFAVDALVATQFAEKTGVGGKSVLSEYAGSLFVARMVSQYWSVLWV